MASITVASAAVRISLTMVRMTSPRMRAYRLRLLTVANGFGTSMLTICPLRNDCWTSLPASARHQRPDGGLYPYGRHSAARQKSAATGADDQGVKIGNLFGDFRAHKCAWPAITGGWS